MTQPREISQLRRRFRGQARQESLPLLFVDGVYQHDGGNLRRVALVVESHGQPAEGMADEDIGARNRGGVEQSMQVGDDVFDGSRLRRGITAAQSRAVIGDDSGEGGDLLRDVIVEAASRAKPISRTTVGAPAPRTLPTSRRSPTLTASGASSSSSSSMPSTAATPSGDNLR